MSSNNPFKESWKDKFGLSNRERRGVVILFCLLFAEVLLLFYLHYGRSSSSVAQTVNPEYNSPYHQSYTVAAPLSKNYTYPESHKDPKPFHRKQKEFILVDVATADSAELVKLPCIGPVKARIISEYREKLGGFNSINQLHEVWGINDSIFDIIRPHVTLSDSTHLKKININTSDSYTLGHHPYLYKNKNVCNVIVNYRKQHGNFHSVEDLKRITLVNDELYSKIAPYLTVE